MSDDKFMLISLEDPKMKSLADVLGNKSCKKIIDYLAENVEASEKDLADALSMPINTVEYNLKKLLESGLVQKRKNFFWSKKGKKIAMYELGNKSIIISPRKSVGEKVKSLLPVVMITFAGTIFAYAYQKVREASSVVYDSVSSVAPAEKSIGVAIDSGSALGSSGSTAMDFAVSASSGVVYSPSPLWLWFMSGALLALFIFSIVNWKKL